jgi:Peptidase family S41
MLKKCLVLFSFFLCHPVFEAQTMKRDSVIKDANYLLDFFESTNPDPYSGYGGMVYYGLEKQKLLDKLRKQDFDRFTFYNTLYQFLNQSGDAHTYITDDDGKSNTALSKTYKSPLKFKIANDGLFVQSAIGPYKQWIGSKLLAINNMDELALVKKETSLSHPENLFYAYFSLSNSIASNKGLNKLLIKPDSVFTFKFKTKENKTTVITIPYLLDTNLKQQTFTEQTQWQLPNNEAPYSYRFLGNTAYLKIGSMALSREFFEKQLQLFDKDTNGLRTTFLNYCYELVFKKKPIGNIKDNVKAFPLLTEICYNLLSEMKGKRITKLIIDLRDNRGGDNSIVFPLFYMLRGDVNFSRKTDMLFSTRVSQNFLNQFYEGSIDRYNKEVESNVRVGDFDAYIDADTASAITKRSNFLSRLKEDHFSWLPYVQNLNGQALWSPKDMVVLTNPTTFSSGFIAAVDLQQLGAKLLGVPPAQSTNATMEIIRFTLPYSKFTGWTSSKYLNYFPNQPKTQNVLPIDYPMNWSDFKKYGFSVDAEMQYALDVLNKKK